MANRWYVKQDGQELGPFTESGLQRFLASDQARSGVLIRNGSAGEWLAPSQLGIAGISSVAPAVAAVASAKTSSGGPPETIEPIENLPVDIGKTAFWSRPAT